MDADPRPEEIPCPDRASDPHQGELPPLQRLSLPAFACLIQRTDSLVDVFYRSSLIVLCRERKYSGTVQHAESDKVFAKDLMNISTGQIHPGTFHPRHRPDTQRFPSSILAAHSLADLKTDLVEAIRLLLVELLPQSIDRNIHRALSRLSGLAAINQIKARILIVMSWSTRSVANSSNTPAIPAFYSKYFHRKQGGESRRFSTACPCLI